MSLAYKIAPGFSSQIKSWEFLFAVLISFLLYQLTSCSPNKNASKLDILDGNIAGINEIVRRHTVRLDIEELNPFGLIETTSCTGILISRIHILTAAHCIHKAIEVQVIFEPNQFADTRSITTIKANQFEYHPAYDSQNIKNDVAIVELSRSAPLYFTPVELGDKDDIVRGFPVILAGYGRDGTYDDNSDQKLYVGYNEISSVENQDGLKGEKNQNIILIENDDKHHGARTCHGDSGGPLYIQDLTNNIKLIGVTSHGDPYCQTHSVYMGIHAFWPWIKETMASAPHASGFASHKTTSTSDEFASMTPAICPKSSIASGLNCQGRYCDNISLTCSGDYRHLDGLESWTHYFSEESLTVSNSNICPDNKFLSGIRCRGRYCDELSLRCSNFLGAIRGTCHWSDWFSEEDESINAPLGSYIAGIECRGSYCDDKRAYFCQTQENWTDFSSEEDWEKPNTTCTPGSFITGIACTGRYCDNISVRCTQVISNTDLETTIDWLPYFSEEKSEEHCPTGRAINSIKCEGRYCDNLALGCSLKENINYSDCHWSSSFSEEKGGRLDLAKDYIATGIRCIGRYCDKKQIRSCKSSI